MGSKDWLMWALEDGERADAGEVYATAADLWQDEEVRIGYLQRCVRAGWFREAEALTEVTLQFYRPGRAEREFLSEILAKARQGG